MRPVNTPPELDDRLREWGHYFRDRFFRRRTCASAEKLFRATSDDFGPSGWGDNESAPRTQQPPSWTIRRALETHDYLHRLDLHYRWALTYAYCYPNMDKYRVLTAMRHRTRKRLNWNQFLESVDVGRIRLWAYCLNRHENRYMDRLTVKQ